MKICPTCSKPIPEDKKICDECSIRFSIPETPKKISWQGISSVVSLVISFTALTISVWVSYLDRHENHDLIATVLRTPINVMEPEMSVEAAFINRGNQAEIVREWHLHFSDTENAQDGFTWTYPLNQRIEKGDKQVVRAAITNFMYFNSQPKWLRLCVVSLDQNGTDVQSSWPISKSLSEKS